MCATTADFSLMPSLLVSLCSCLVCCMQEGGGDVIQLVRLCMLHKECCKHHGGGALQRGVWGAKEVGGGSRGGWGGVCCSSWSGHVCCIKSVMSRHGVTGGGGRLAAGVLAKMLTIMLGPCRFSTERSKTSGFSLWIYAVPTSSNSTRLIINAGLSPKAFAAASGPKQAKNPISAVKAAAVGVFTKNRPT